MNPAQIVRRLIAIAALVAIGLAPGAAFAELKVWNQEEVTALAGELRESVSNLRQAWRKDPGRSNLTLSKQRAADSFTNTLRSLETSSRQLQERLKGGGDREATRPVARKIGSLLNDAQVEARGLFMGNWMNERAKTVMEVLNKLAPFYGSEPLYDVENMKRID